MTLRLSSALDFESKFRYESSRATCNVLDVSPSDCNTNSYISEFRQIRWISWKNKQYLVCQHLTSMTVKPAFSIYKTAQRSGLSAISRIGQINIDHRQIRPYPYRPYFSTLKCSVRPYTDNIGQIKIGYKFSHSHSGNTFSTWKSPTWIARMRDQSSFFQLIYCVERNLDREKTWPRS